MNKFDPPYPDAKSKTSFQDGMEYQDFVSVVLERYGIVIRNFSSRKSQFQAGENPEGYEIKYDDYACACKQRHYTNDLCRKPGRISIEVAEKTRNDECLRWTRSGILRNDNSSRYVQGNYTVIFIFKLEVLVEYYENRRNRQGFIKEKLGTIKTFYLPNEDAWNLAEEVIVIDAKTYESAARILGWERTG